MAKVTTPIGLALQGIDSFAVVEAGAVEALCDGLCSPIAISGTATGAINAVLIAGSVVMERPGLLSNFWRSVGPNIPTEGIHLPNLISQLEFQVDFRALKESRIKLALEACDVETGDFIIFSNEHGGLTANHVLACAVSPLSPPVVIEGRFYWGAGYLGGTAFGALDFLLRDFLLSDFDGRLPVVTVTKRTLFGPVPRTEREAVMRASEIVRDRIFNGGTSQADLASMLSPSVPWDVGRSRSDYGWLKNLRKITVPDAALLSDVSLDKISVNLWLDAGRRAAGDFEVEADMPPLSGLPVDSRVNYATLVNIGNTGEVFQLAFIPSSAQNIPLSNGQIIKTPSDMVIAIENILSRRPVFDNLDPNYLTRIASALVYDVNIPVSNSPIKGWTVAALLGGGHVSAALLKIDPGQLPIIIVELAGTLLLLGGASVVRRALEGFSRGAEEAGLAFGRKFFHVGTKTSPKRRSKVPTLKTLKGQKGQKGKKKRPDP